MSWGGFGSWAEIYGREEEEVDAARHRQEGREATNEETGKIDRRKN